MTIAIMMIAITTTITGGVYTCRKYIKSFIITHTHTHTQWASPILVRQKMNHFHATKSLLRIIVVRIFKILTEIIYFNSDLPTTTAITMTVTEVGLTMK